MHRLTDHFSRPSGGVGVTIVLGLLSSPGFCFRLAPHSLYSQFYSRSDPSELDQIMPRQLPVTPTVLRPPKSLADLNDPPALSLSLTIWVPPVYHLTPCIPAHCELYRLGLLLFQGLCTSCFLRLTLSLLHTSTHIQGTHCSLYSGLCLDVPSSDRLV